VRASPSEILARAAELGAAAWVSPRGRIVEVAGARADDLVAALARDEARRFFDSVASYSAFPLDAALSFSLSRVSGGRVLAWLVVTEGLAPEEGYERILAVLKLLQSP
jgi:hypothetical protein